MIRTPPDFSHAYLKLDRASEHMDALYEQTEAFLKLDPAPFDFRTKATARPGKAISYVLYAVVRQEPPRRLGLTVGDAIQNMRHALEFIVYELSPPSRRNQGKTGFPVFDDRCRFEVHGASLIKGITGDARTLIERLQPYNTAHPPLRNDPLFILNKLANQDKHRLLLPVVTAVSESDTWMGSANANIRIDRFNPGPVEHDAEILAFTATPEDPAEDMYVQPQSGLQYSSAGLASSASKWRSANSWACSTTTSDTRCWSGDSSTAACLCQRSSQPFTPRHRFAVT